MHFWLFLSSANCHVSISHGTGGSVRELVQQSLPKSLSYIQALSLHQQSQNASHSEHLQQPSHVHQIPAKRGKGRPRRLWELCLDLLLDADYSPKFIRWVDRRDAVFRVVNSKEIAKMWGAKNGNKEMTYEKFSRSMR